MKAEVDNLDVNKLVNLPISLNNIKTKVVDLDVGKLKVVPIDLKNRSDAVKDEVFKNTKYNTLQKKVIELDKKTRNATTSIHINQYNTVKQNLEKCS